MKKNIANIPTFFICLISAIYFLSLPLYTNADEPIILYDDFNNSCSDSQYNFSYDSSLNFSTGNCSNQDSLGVVNSSEQELVNAVDTTITLYIIEDSYFDESKYISTDFYIEFMTASQQHTDSYTFEYGSNATYSVSGDSVSVTSSGVVTPTYTVYYWWKNNGIYYGNTSPGNGDYDYSSKQYSYTDSVVTVTYNGTSTTYTFSIKNYPPIYAAEKAQRFIDEKITSSMTTLEKFTEIVNYPASMEYSASYSSYENMLIYGGGDCWSSALLINYLCSLVDIPCHTRYVNGNSEGGHRNNVALIDGELYLGDAGFSEKAPRYYALYKLNSAYTFDYTGEIKHYDGFDTELVVPETIVDTTVTSIGTLAFSSLRCSVTPTKLVLPDTLITLQDQALAQIPYITEITVPQNVSSIGNFVFSSCASLQKIEVASGNTYFCSENGVLFNKDKTTLLYYPTNGKEEYTVPSTVTKIAYYSLSHTTGIEKLIIPSSVATIEEGAFYDTKLKEIYFLGDKPELGDYVFASTNATVYYPAGNTTWSGIENETFESSKVTFVAIEGNKVEEASLTLTAEIVLNYKLHFSHNAYTVKIEAFNTTTTYNISSLTKKPDGYYYISFPVPAKNIYDKIKLSVYDSSGTMLSLVNKTSEVNVFPYSVVTYLDSLNSIDENMTELVNAIKQYGQCAQIYFNYNAPSTAPVFSTNTALSNFYHKQITGTLPDGVTYCGASLILDEGVTIRHYFYGNVSGFQCTGYSGDFAYIDSVSNGPLSFNSYSKVYFENWSIEYSVLSYCYEVIQTSDNPDLVNLMYSMYWYYTAAVYNSIIW